ncbi:MAG: DUF4442 domain-containing protein [Puia sp.]|nr:DUF4442 domain-containing protein [Puia sp.]
MPTQTEKFIGLLKSPVKFRLFLFYRIPSAFFSGVRIREIAEERSEVTVPYKWFSQNPFRSTYFACLGMAAEMSAGSLAMAHSYKSDPPVSMLVVGLESKYFKKATGLTTFLCTDGMAVKAAIEEAVRSGQPQTLVMKSTGTNEAGDPVAEFLITWSFKAKTKVLTK